MCLTWNQTDDLKKKNGLDNSLSLLILLKKQEPVDDIVVIDATYKANAYQNGPVNILGTSKEELWFLTFVIVATYGDLRSLRFKLRSATRQLRSSRHFLVLWILGQLR